MQLQDLKQNGWVVQILANPFLELNSILENQVQHEIPVISIPSSVTVIKFNYQYKFWIFDDSVNVAGEVCDLELTDF